MKKNYKKFLKTIRKLNRFIERFKNVTFKL